MTEPEARYYLRQTILGCQYLHGNRVIHRDLKLGNLFLNDDMEVKIGMDTCRALPYPLVCAGEKHVQESVSPGSLSLPLLLQRALGTFSLERWLACRKDSGESSSFCCHKTTG